MNHLWVTSQETCAPTEFLSHLSQVHLPSTCQLQSAPSLSESGSILGEWRESLGSGAYYIQVRGSQAFISIPGPVKATQLCTALTHTKASWPLNGLPAGLFTVMGFSHTGSHENEDPVLWQIVWFVAELFNLYCVLLFYFGILWLRSNNVKCILRECGLLVTGRDSLFGEDKIRLRPTERAK